jgi:hypothetical protein
MKEDTKGIVIQRRRKYAKNKQINEIDKEQ